MWNNEWLMDTDIMDKWNFIFLIIRQLFEVAIQAAVNGRVIARET